MLWWSTVSKDDTRYVTKMQKYLWNFSSRLHWRIWNCWRPPIGQNRRQSHRPTKQVRCHQPPFRREASRSRVVHPKPTAISSVRLPRLDHIGRYHGSRRGPKKASWRQNLGFLFLKKTTSAYVDTELISSINNISTFSLSTASTSLNNLKILILSYSLFWHRLLNRESKYFFLKALFMYGTQDTCAKLIVAWELPTGSTCV